MNIYICIWYLPLVVVCAVVVAVAVVKVEFTVDALVLATVSKYR